MAHAYFVVSKTGDATEIRHSSFCGWKVFGPGQKGAYCSTSSIWPAFKTQPDYRCLFLPCLWRWRWQSLARERAGSTDTLCPVAQTWSGSWRLGQSHWVLVVTWSFYFGGISLVLAIQFPVSVPRMQVTLPLVPKQAHSCTSSISASGIQVVYRYHYPAPQSLHWVTGHSITLPCVISSIK